MDDKKNEIQKKIKKDIIKNKFRGIVLSAVRTGKTRIILEAIKDHSKDKDVVVFIAYPNIDIKKSWEEEMDKINYHPSVIFSTFISLKKFENVEADYFIFDESHLLPEENIVPIVSRMCEKNKYVILASGTFSPETLNNLSFSTKLDLIVNYTLNDAIEDSIIIDFKVYVHHYKLDCTKIKEFGKVKKWNSTEAKECKRLTNRIISSYGSQQKMFAALARMRFINSCDSLISSVKAWINKNKDERFLLFVGDEKIGINYNIPMFNSKSKNNDVLIQFQKKEINQLCLIKKGSAGITYPNLQHILITAINSNGENLEQQIGRSLLQDTKNAEIHIFVSDQSFQLKWLNSALSNISKKRITYL